MMNKTNKIIGYLLVGLQLLATLVFTMTVYRLGMLPVKYMAAFLVVSAVLWLIGFFGQRKAKKNGIAGKIYCVIVTLLLIWASVQVYDATSAMKTIGSGESKKVDNVVTAVMKDDPAENIQDAADYGFGVQYVLKGEEIRQAVAGIENETGKPVDTKEYDSIQAQLAALYDGKVQAIVFNEAYISLLEDEMPAVGESIKVIYSYTIEREIEREPEKMPTEVKTEAEPFAVYISGIDVYGSIRKTSRSDVNIIAFVNPQSRQILLVTTPRDYYVKLPGVSGDRRDKLTHAGIYGVDVSMATLEQLYDTELDFYARVNFTSLIKIVDTLGGVDVYSKYAFTTRSGSLTVSKGMNHFNGEQALAFSRERYNVPGGDFQRGKDQQAVIIALIKKMISPASLTNAGKLVEELSESVDTNMEYEHIQELVKNQLNNPGAWNIKTMAAEGKGDRQVTYSMPGRSLYVAQPVQRSVDEIKTEITALKNGEILEDTTVVENE